MNASCRRHYYCLLVFSVFLGACDEGSLLPTAQLEMPKLNDSLTPVKTEYKTGEVIAVRPKEKSPVLSNKVKRYRETNWSELIPKDWDPSAPFKGLNLSTLKDSDPRAIEAMAILQKAWENAPTDLSMNGASIRIAGFIVPLEREGDLVRELLLVPYYGACIHVPPPPANQIIHVIVDPPLKDARTMDAMWISGTLETIRTPSFFGSSGYRMKATKVDPYTIPQP